MKKRLISGCVVAALVFAVGLPRAAAQEDDCLQKGGMWDATQQKCLINVNAVIKIDYPLALAKTAFIGQVVDQFMADQRVAFLSPLTEDRLYYSPGPLTLQIDYATSNFSDRIVNLIFTVYAFEGGAHGLTTTTTYTFNLAQQRVLSLSDLFVPGSDPLSVIGPLVEADLDARLTTDLANLTDTNWIHQGTGENLDNYKSWTITPDSLTFYFDPYQVAAYAAGTQTVTIPLAQLSAILAAPFNGGGSIG
jgi:hypothetical protein